MLIDNDKLRDLARKVTGQAPSCDLCFGVCRHHGMGDKAAWEPEIGSAAWAAQIEGKHQQALDNLARAERMLQEEQQARKLLALTMRQIRDETEIGDAKPDQDGITTMGRKLDKIAELSTSAVDVDTNRVGTTG